MHIKALEVANFRAIEYAGLEDLPATVVIAGPNGCGKSCLFDALRLWKSAYGGYSDNEWQQWFGEFQINLDQSQPELRTLFRDRDKPIRIAATVVLAEDEKDYLRENVVQLLTPLVWRQLSMASGVPRKGRRSAVAAQLRSHGPEVDERVEAERSALLVGLEATAFSGEFVMDPTLSLAVTPNPVLQLIYSLYVPDAVGVFEYHSAQRNYQREQVSNVDLRLEVAEQQQSQHALYNWATKYQNVKTQLAANYIRELIAERAGVAVPHRTSLIESLKELFRLFFPDKEFLGAQPTPNGKLTFNVKTASGKEHDINELSSGEKEVLYGYLRLRNLAPRNSVLLLDEPELHLNPRLIKGLPQYYHRHLGDALSNQIWLLTHSDVLLREALDQADFALYHMVPASSDSSRNQLIAVAPGESLERAILDLVGEIASYRPDGKLVIFEGGGDTDFDVGMTCDLFPLLRSDANTISGSNRARVRDLHRLLERASSAGRLKLKVFSVVDRDSDALEAARQSRELMWDVYHIENYLLEPKYVLEALSEALRERNRLRTEARVYEALHESAGAAAEFVLRQRLENWANSLLVNSIAVGSDPRPAAMSQTLHHSIVGSKDRVNATVVERLTLPIVEAKVNELRTELQRDLASDKWRLSLPGREILSRFAGRYAAGLEYEVLRNLIIARMRKASFQPAGMKVVVDSILAG